MTKISAFTIIRNGVEFDYPFIESIKSALPLCDEFVINIGKSTDDTKTKIENFTYTLTKEDQKKFILFESEWPLNDPEKRKGGKILSEQTNLALDRCTGDWCLYLQADEVLHEEDYAEIKRSIQKAESKQAEAVVFQYVHFYANYNVIQTSRSSYRREMRLIRNLPTIRSTGDAQSFRHTDGSKLTALLTKARIFHYGWVKHQEVMKKKTGFMDTLYHPGATKEAPATGDNYVFKRFVGLKEFIQTHPAVMQERVRSAASFDFSRAPRVFELKDSWKLISGWIESVTGVRLFEYKNYKLK